ncbi:MAG: transglutaminase family protein [Rhodobacter sp.]|uniref:transglutaminase family protein n=1 Tax=Pararhodobacter sp. TaxID=2127056 RepID=UPI001DCAE943|nr:transglutaminase family protein [Pararhodobacter sp.]MCB1345506.1 transglutaminase family protein [Paracoccaceae bacterium]MCC0074130.1 transglutaminase family protein [Rhodobacter sp.]HPD92225.1 transglutaminase family protein [Pararhodobacter sp.]
MRLTVDHVTSYLYEQPVRLVVQSHRLTPTLCRNQSVLDWTVTVSDGLEGGAFRDGAGDWVQGWTVRGPVSRIDVTVRGTVETHDRSGILRGNREGIPVTAWLDETAPTRPDTVLREMAAAGDGADALALAHDLSARVAAAIAYRPGATHAHTTAAEALALGEGVCQDHAHALIALARLRDLPARYVSGYLFADAEGTAHEAAHAWAEIWIDTLGWVGFDPANRCCPDERYIRLGCGADARAAAPIRGIARGGAREVMEIAVAVAAAQQ